MSKLAVPARAALEARAHRKLNGLPKLPRTRRPSRDPGERLRSWVLGARWERMLATDHRVFISSTSEDLIDFRRAVAEAIAAMDGFAVVMMEDFGARNEEPAGFCRRMVSGCDVVIVLAGHRFGGAPAGSARSFTQLEYDAAKELGKGRLVFLADNDFPIPADQIEDDERRRLQRRFRAELASELVRAEFRTKEMLAAQAVAALANWAREQDQRKNAGRGGRGLLPVAPQPYVVHPYPIQSGFTGRIAERSALTRWFRTERVALHAVVALGGMGKSAVTWCWFQEDLLGREVPGNSPLEPEDLERCRVPEGERPDAGVMWWSFYENEATFEAWVQEALRYMGVPESETPTSAAFRVRTLVQLLSQRRMLIVMDGVERILSAYAGLSAPYQGDRVDVADQSHRACIDPNAAWFLRAIAAQDRARLLFSTRLFPSELDNLAGAARTELGPLPEADAVSFYRKKGILGTDVEIRTVCQRYGCHPLALALLAGLIRTDPQKPSDITVANEYDPVPDLVPREHHVLEIAFGRLDADPRRALTTMAAFRFPMQFETIERILGEGTLEPGLAELEDKRRNWRKWCQEISNALDNCLDEVVARLSRELDDIQGTLGSLHAAPAVDGVLATLRILNAFGRLGSRGKMAARAAELEADFARLHAKYASAGDAASEATRTTAMEPLHEQQSSADELAIRNRCERVLREMSRRLASGWRAFVGEPFWWIARDDRADLKEIVPDLLWSVRQLQSERALMRFQDLADWLAPLEDELAVIQSEIQANEDRAPELQQQARSGVKKALSALVDRGFVMFDRTHRQFDLHPIVRQYAYDRLNEPNRVHAEMRDYFSALPQPDVVTRPEDLAPTIELYHHTLLAGQGFAAGRLFRERLVSPLFYRFGAYRTCIELLEPAVTADDLRTNLAAELMSTLIHAYSLTGKTREAKECAERLLGSKPPGGLTDRLQDAVLTGLADDLMKLGSLKEAAGIFSQAAGWDESSSTWDRDIHDLVLRGSDLKREHSKLLTYMAPSKVVAKYKSERQRLEEGYSSDLARAGETAMGRNYLALAHLASGLPGEALAIIDEGLRLRGRDDGADSLTWCQWLRGACLLALARHEEAGVQIQEALLQCRKTELVELEAAILTTRADWVWKTGSIDEALLVLEEATAIAERCEYRLQQADIHNLRAELQFAKGELKEAAREVSLAVERSTCDGAPYSYHLGLQTAQRIKSLLNSRSKGSKPRAQFPEVPACGRDSPRARVFGLMWLIVSALAAFLRWLWRRSPARGHSPPK